MNPNNLPELITALQKELKKHRIHVKKTNITIEIDGDQLNPSVSINGQPQPELNDALEEAISQTHELIYKTITAFIINKPS